MKNRKKIVFLASGNGGNLCFISKAIEYGLLQNSEIVFVICDRLCGAYTYANKNFIPSKIILIDKNDQSQLISILEKIAPDIIISNIHKILNDDLVHKYQNKLINLHYSLLPAFSGLIGMNSVTQAINYGAKFLGVTVHYVAKEVDKGPPISQIAFPYNQTKSDYDTKNLIFRLGCLCLLASLEALVTNKLNTINAQTISNLTLGECTLSGAVLSEQALKLDESFWSSIKQEVL